jgi:tetratricopeptide (TPR) repeat protein
MQKTGKLGLGILFLLIFLIQPPLLAQNKKYFVITGRIVPQEAENGGGSIDIAKNGTVSSTIDIPRNGRFRFELEFFSNYTLTFKYPGHFNKIIEVSTEIPEEVWKRDNDFPPFPMVVQMIKEFEGIDKSFAQKPSGRIFYGKDIDNFEKESYMSDIQFIDQINTAKNKANEVQKEDREISKENAQDLAARQKNYDQAIKEADALYQRGEYQSALLKYMDARGLFPDRSYPNDRVAELQDLVKALEITAKQKAELEQKYKDAIAKANSLFDQKSYKDARPVYQQALQFKPGDTFANGRISEIDQALGLQEKQNQYKDVIAQADQNFNAQKYDLAASLYSQAKQLMPAETYPQTQLDLIAQRKAELARTAQLDKDFADAMQLGNDQEQQKDFLKALESFKKALGIKPENQLAKDKITEVQQAIVDVENDRKYQEAVQLGDKALAGNDLNKAKSQYQAALQIKANEKYPKDKLAEIAAKESNEIKFNDLVASGDKAFTDNKPDESLGFFNQALAIKPGDKAVLKRIEDVQALKKRLDADKAYNDFVAHGDQAFENDQLAEALSAYNNALGIRKLEKYPKDQVKKIEDYQAAIKKADKLFDAKDYPASLNGYNDALSAKANDKYASGKVAEIQKMMDDLKQQQEAVRAQLQAYNDAVKAADQLLAAKRYPESLNKYQEASKIKDDEAYPKKKIKEVQDILDGIAKENARKEADYKSAIADADRLLGQKDYENARSGYQKALGVKPEDSYATGQIKQIDDTLAEIKRKQDADARAQLQAYNDAVKAADQLLAAKSYPESLNKYQEASKIKDDEAYPKKKIKEVQDILDGIARENARKEADYNSAIADADRLLGQKDYENARSGYQKALGVKPEDSYATGQIKKIDDTLAEIRRQQDEQQRLAAEKQNKDYGQAMAAGDKAFEAKDYATAQTSYQSALTIKPGDATAKQKLRQTEAAIAQLARLTQAYNKAIDEANRRLTAKKYQDAKEKYQEALQYLPDEEYPKTQIAKIDEVLAQQLAEEQRRKEFDQAVADGEAQMKGNELSKARESFVKANNLIPSEPLPPKRMKEIDALLAEQARKSAAEQKTMEAYQDAIKRADQLFAGKDYPSAKTTYHEALSIKPDEKYPADQLALIEKLVKEQIEQQYKDAIAKGDEAFNAENYDAAIDPYKEALTYKNGDKYATGKLAEIDRKMKDLEAERIRQQKIDEQYKAVLADALKDFDGKKYQIAKDKYQKASSLKPTETFPKDQIAKIDQILNDLQKQQETNAQYAQFVKDAESAFRNQKLKDSRDLYQKARDLKPDEPVPPARIAEIEKLIAQQEELAKQTAAEEAQRLAKEAADKKYYDDELAEGDREFKATQYKIARDHFTNASNVRPNEKYPKDQISKIDELLARQEADRLATLTKAKQDSIRREKDKLFDATIAEGNHFEQNKQFQEAIRKYQDAIQIKPEERTNVQKLIADATAKMQALAKQLAEYNRIIKNADNLYGQSKLAEALVGYQTALSVKPDEEYPKKQIQEIQSQLAAIEKNYSDAVKRADTAYDSANWADAKAAYTEALTVKPKEKYPADRLKDVNQKMTEAAKAEQATAALNKAYQEAIEKAEKAFHDDQLPVAKTQYQVAQSLKPEEKLPPEKIKEIDTLIDQRNKEKLAQAQRELDEKYQQAISLADNSFREKSYSTAKLQYNQALLIKPEEEYPKNQMAVCDRLMNEPRPAETPAKQAPDTTNSVLAQARPVEAAPVADSGNPNYATTDNYDEAIKKADDSFGLKDYTVARFYYYRANQIKPDEQYPKDQIDAIRKLIDGKMSAGELADYDQAIRQADEAFSKANYSVARFYYYKALGVKSWEKYPKDRIEEIDRLTNSLLSEQKEKEYRDSIAKADEALTNNDFPIARFYYNRALSIKKGDEYPRIKLNDIRKLVEQGEKDQLQQQYQKYIDDGDQAMKSENYSIARYNYNMALTVKPDEKYPKDQLKLIRDALNKKAN